MECNKFMSNKLAKEIKDATLAFQHVEWVGNTDHKWKRNVNKI
jgi:hypothetical protein